MRPVSTVATPRRVALETTCSVARDALSRLPASQTASNILLAIIISSLLSIASCRASFEFYEAELTVTPIDPRVSFANARVDISYPSFWMSNAPETGHVARISPDGIARVIIADYEYRGVISNGSTHVRILLDDLGWRCVFLAHPDQVRNGGELVAFGHTYDGSTEPVSVVLRPIARLSSHKE